MAATTRGILLGLLAVLEFLEFITSPIGLIAAISCGFYGAIAFSGWETVVPAVFWIGLGAIVLHQTIAQP